MPLSDVNISGGVVCVPNPRGNYTAVIALLARGADPSKKTTVLGCPAIFVAADFGRALSYFRGMSCVGFH